MGGKSSGPAAPDYRRIAREQGQLNREAQAYDIYANRPTQTTPWGQLTWTPEAYTDPSTGKRVTRWGQTQTLDPRLQGALESQFDVQRARSGAAAGMGGQLAGFASPMDYSQFRDISEVGDPSETRQRAEDTAYERMASRLDPQMEQRGQQLQIQLRNQGLRPGDQAYEAEMERFNRDREDAYANLRAQALTQGRAEASQMFGQQQSRQAQEAQLRNQEIQEAIQRRDLPVAEMNRLLGTTSQAVQAPTTPGFMSAGTTRPTDIMGASQAQHQAALDAYSRQQQQRQNFMSGLTNIGTAALGFFSDRRLKKGAKQVGVTARGTPIYQYRLGEGGETQIGVLADEVPNDAKFIDHETGYLKVDYARV